MALANQNSSRAAALARRKAMSSGGKAALSGQNDRLRSAPEHSKAEVSTQPVMTPAAAPRPASSPASSYRPRVATPVSNTSRQAALARRKAMSTKGKSAYASQDRTRDYSMLPQNSKAVADTSNQKSDDCGCGCGGKGDCGDTKTEAAPATQSRSPVRSKRKVNKPKVALNPSKAAALARRKAQSTRGKAGLSSNGLSQAQTARAANPDLSSRELAKTLREQRSKQGKSGSGEHKCRPTGKLRPNADVGAAQDASWKVGITETSHGQSVTGTMVGRDQDVTGNEASTCRTITGTEYMGAEVFRDFCQAEPQKSHRRVGVSNTLSGNSVTGNEVGRSSMVTGDEPGTCKNITGTEYVSANQAEAFCATPTKSAPISQVMGQSRKGKVITGDNVDSNSKVTGGEAGSLREPTGSQYVKSAERHAPAKVGVSQTLRGGAVTGTEVGRSQKMTGDEAGSCRNVTGDDYIGKEQFNTFCESVPAPQDRKVGISSTNSGKSVTGTMTGRGKSVTGNEPGTCKAVTGTPYAGMEQASDFCEAPQTKSVAARTQVIERRAGANMTGLQPGIGGKMTGAEKGACETVSGTPYVGRDQVAQNCASQAAEPGSSDFPKPVGGAEWGGFSVASPSHASNDADAHGEITGTQYEKGHITGPFGMATGKVTGTEQARFGNSSLDVIHPAENDPAQIDGRIKSRVTGEGQDAGLKITGDDWDRGDRVTGTEGSSSTVRNETRRGMGMMAATQRNIEAENPAPQPVSRVTGSSGNYENGSLITYSGGARG